MSNFKRIGFVIFTSIAFSSTAVAAEGVPVQCKAGEMSMSCMNPRGLQCNEQARKSRLSFNAKGAIVDKTAQGEAGKAL